MYLEAVDLDPDLKEAWFDLGLIYKWSARWEECFDANKRAALLVGERRDAPEWWNLGIAATALHRWDDARRAWGVYGVDIRDGPDEIDFDGGPCPVRINPRGSAEVVWGRRLCPARIQIESVPFPESGHRWHDIVLHDGVPNGYRESGGREFPVFDELEKWRDSAVPTMVVSVETEGPDHLDPLLRAFDAAGLPVENWTTSVQMLCQDCSEGRPHQAHEDQNLREGRSFVLGSAGDMAAARNAAASWHEPPARIVSSVEAR
jgi:hypothetical protein